MVQDGVYFVEMPSCIERVFHRKYLRCVQLCGPYYWKCLQASVLCILSYTAEPVDGLLLRSTQISWKAGNGSWKFPKVQFGVPVLFDKKNIMVDIVNFSQQLFF